MNKLKIEAYKDIKYNDKIAEDFEVMFNPASYNQKFDIEFEEAQGKGTSASEQKFKRIKPKEFSIEFQIDGTGAAAPKVDVAKKIDQFIKLTAKLNGEIHRTTFLKLSWGSLISYCVLKTADITYNLFKPDGYPLRAKVNATFAEIQDDKKRAALENKNSPDLSHVRVVGEGDTLPLMAHRIYGDSKYYIDLARINNLTNFRKLQPGTQLYFPPIRKKNVA
ncbi:MAG: LysM peptidoglycan-binding domain-containing protein [Deferribacteres bacterium]|nr:LysM peptidoglycan-binding domain-containing protein [candidate division KSB1 bacterium]MCB9500643.1 LysM peptidoglycan-binding domain-containing protein [Deferribacteres bacterium]